ncbi:hypothetical protein EYF80_055897 [Liparis tanakae]|uniref:Uncharacterized protein n=1 Tax=Liparis tanakae TaxID=230148 RepID=A0A4Z2F0C0_9TELE|nr:hypothetical protein EYF80_055897 [Liparis tanakae]
MARWETRTCDGVVGEGLDVANGITDAENNDSDAASRRPHAADSYGSSFRTRRSSSSSFRTRRSSSQNTSHLSDGDFPSANKGITSSETDALKQLYCSFKRR